MIQGKKDSIFTLRRSGAIRQVAGTPMVPSSGPTLLALALAVTAGGACGSSVPIGYCAALPSIAVELTVRDSVSGTGVADSATGTVAAASYQDSLHHVQSSDSLLWGGEQLGTYTVTIHRPAYATWTKANVLVSRRAPCGNVIPVQLVALLVRTP
jgi:hypothetical protein